MKKKISLLLCILALTFGLVGCSDEKVADETEQSMIQNATVMLENLTQLTEEDMNSFRDTSSFQLDYIMMYYSMPVSGENFLGLLNSWQAAVDECGDFESYDIDEYEAKQTSEGYELSVDATFDDRDAKIIFVFDDKFNIQSMDVSAEYETSEILGKAGLNTLLGMGTVFAVLIFLAFLISLMKYTDKMLDFGNKVIAFIKNSEKPQNEVDLKEVIEDKENVEDEQELSDDLELVAVISAAIAASEGTSTDGFVVRSIRRRPSNNWN